MEKRDSWSSKKEYVLSMVGLCVGLGNVWRFPYVCITNGGGAFILPFIISLIFCAMPVFFLETALGQFLGKSCWHTWSMCPILKGLGMSMNFLNFSFTVYYAVILGWTLIFIVNSFQSPLPWTRCDQWWNTPNCITPYSDTTTGLKSTHNNITVTAISILSNASDLGLFNSNQTDYNLTSWGNSSFVANATGVITNKTSTSTEEFWLRNVLQLSSGVTDLGGIPWHTVTALIASNIFVFAGIVKGIKTSGKVVYITATLPYILLTVMLILGCTLPGAKDGIIYYIKPDFSKLLTYEPWTAACIQVFYSLVAGWGPIITMASYNKFHNDCMRDSIMLAVVCEGTSLYGGFALFSILGHMAYKAGVHVSNYAKSGPGLVFVVYPAAISYLPLPQLWGVLFFLMLFTLGLDSMFSCVETMVTVLADVWPSFVKKWRVAISAVTMIIITLAGLIFVTRGGMYWFQLCDWYIAAFAILLQAAIECVTVAWIYGVDRFNQDIKLMIGREPMTFFVISWKIITPSILMVIWLMTLITYKPPNYEGYEYPPGAEVGGWIFAVAPFVAVVVYAVYEVMRQTGTLRERLVAATTPTQEWAPAIPEAKEKYQYDTLLTKV